MKEKNPNEEQPPMNEKNPIEDLFDKLGGLLNFIGESGNASIQEQKLTPEVYAKLEKIERDVQNFKNLSDQIIEMSDISAEEMKKRLLGISENVSPTAKRLMEKGRHLKGQLTSMKENFNLEEFQPIEENLSSGLSNAKEPNASEEKKYRMRRRRKFKQFGG